MMRWGIIGLGRIADTEIAPAITTSPHGELRAVVSREQGRADAFAGRHGAARALTSFRELLADPGVDAVYIATPNALHAEQVVAAARAGKHVMCDKPLALTVADARRAVSACEEANVRLGITFQTRFHDNFGRFREVVQGGSLGEIRVVQVEMSPGRTLLKGWRTDPALAGLGALNNLGVHAFDLVSWLLGADVTEVTAMAGHEGGLEPETLALVLLRYGTGALAYVNVNQSVAFPQADITVYGTRGRVVGRSVSRMNMEGSLSVLTEEGETTIETASYHAYRGAVMAFEEAVAAGREPSPSGLDGLRSVELTSAIAESLRGGRTTGVKA
ncbi:MAG TPA: Gfo/Idh/MocA family oxidoreductase [Streptosporangiaceae bacterium]|nr:Gfo/Idh/MocA family oxidoreductase [Streptosporangiaceae bacterium]